MFLGALIILTERRLWRCLEGRVSHSPYVNDEFSQSQRRQKVNCVPNCVNPV